MNVYTVTPEVRRVDQYGLMAGYDRACAVITVCWLVHKAGTEVMDRRQPTTLALPTVRCEANNHAPLESLSAKTSMIAPRHR